MLQEFLSLLPFMNPVRAQLVIDAFWPMVVAGFKISLPLAIVSFIFGLMIAVAVALIRISPAENWIHKILLSIVKIYVSIIRGTPMLVQIFVVFYGLPALNIVIDPRPAAIIAFSLNVGAYASENIRAAILSVHKGQWEAGYSIGMTYLQTFRRIIAPQAFRTAVPTLSNNFIALFKDTSLASLVTVTELFRVAQQYANASYDFRPVYIEAGLVYWCYCTVLFAIQAFLERRSSQHIAK